MKTPYCSYCLNGVATGCRYCVKGEKLVLFVSGICSRNCWYCSLSDKRKNKDIIMANERRIKDEKGLISEVIESNATSAGITGGDPLLFVARTIKYSKALKKRFGKKFHIHIYLPTKLANKNNLKRLSEYIDEVRFNPGFSTDSDKDTLKKDLETIGLANKFWKKENIGIELPMIPDKKKQFLELLEKASPSIGFANLNEFELSETNFEIVTKKYKLNQGGYTIKDSIRSGIWILDQLKKKRSKLKIHLCTADLKNQYQFQNRLKRHKILPFGYRTEEGMVKYLILDKIKPSVINDIKKISKKGFFIDKKKKQLILSEPLAKKLLEKDYNIKLIEEFPTYDRIETEKQEI